MAQEGGEHTQPPALPPKQGIRSSIIKRIPYHGLIDSGIALRRGYLHLEHSLQEVKAQPVPQEVRDAYLQNREVIESIYGKAHANHDLLYHGTGALQYAGNKYQEGTSNEYRHPLDSILQDGLKPHEDTWITTREAIDSTSFATTWPYAKWYADKHQNPNDPLEWNYGDSNEWFSYCMWDTVQTEAKNPRNYKQLPPLVAKKILKFTGLVKKPTDSQKMSALKKLTQWVSDLTTEVTTDTPVAEILRGQTDIPDNFGAIVTVSRDDVELFDMGPGRVYEERTMSQVPPQKFISLAVPLDRVEEYAAKVAQLGLNFPVLPIEAVDYHMSQFPLKDLTTASKTPPLKSA